MKKTPAKRVIGTTDFVDVLDANLYDLACKVDTGADTSSIHCSSIKIKVIEGEEYLAFTLLDRKHPQYRDQEILTKNFKEKKVKSSFGNLEVRYQVKLKIRLMKRTYKAFFTLSNRINMKYPVLLGKRFLKNKYIVDVSLVNVSQH